MKLLLGLALLAAGSQAAPTAPQGDAYIKLCREVHFIGCETVKITLGQCGKGSPIVFSDWSATYWLGPAPAEKLPRFMNDHIHSVDVGKFTCNFYS
jgi:hypothetical protein